jgi:L-lactate utilization protein LutB
MPQTPALTIVEPAPARRRAAGIVARKESRLDLESVKTELAALRRYCRDHATALMERYRNSLTRLAGVKWTVAPDAAQAACYVKQLAGRTDLVSLNKSSVVLNELRPQLQAVGLHTYVRYFQEFETFENQVEDYWGLPGFHEKGLVETFEVARTFADLKSGQARDYLAVVGVNAVSAEDGSAYFLQHTFNIARDLEQAKKIVLVVTPEKVVQDRAAALLQTKSMGVFGLESVLLNLGPKAVEKYDFERLPTFAGERELHILILDNGRTEVFADRYRDLFLCIDCRACSRQCPIGQHTDVPAGSWTPKNYLLGFLQGGVASTESCLHCGRCHVECPVDIDLPALIWRAQFEHYAKHRRSWKKQLLDAPEAMAKLGCLTAPLSNWTSHSSVCKRVLEAVMGVHRDAPRPAFHRQTFKKWVARRD